MKYLDEYREPQSATDLINRIKSRCSRPWNIMDVCGGQTHNLLRSGIEQELASHVRLIHGPGCPVCVTPAEAIDEAVRLSMQPGNRVAAFGDMLRVPGSCGSLLEARARGGQVQLVTSPLDAVRMALQSPLEHIVYFAVGFETTAPASALAVLQAQKLRLTNFSILSAHVRVLPAMEQIAHDTDCAVDAFLAAGHVCAVIGCEEHDQFAERFGKPVAVTGFEPLDLLMGISAVVDQLENRTAGFVNCYARSAAQKGNLHAQQLINAVFEAADHPWRGFGIMPRGGLALRPDFEMFNAKHRFKGSPPSLDTDGRCPLAAVLSGKMNPPQCPHFATECTPEHPLGAPMISDEGACAAYYRYHRRPVHHA